jgi:CRISPR-associated endonuclease/helicase Cas3
MISDHRLFWAKASKTSTDYHPVIFHLIDVGLSALHWLQGQSPEYLDRLSSGFGLSKEETIRFISFLCASHDIGKINPGFQSKSEIQAERLHELGYRTFPENDRYRHGSVSYFIMMDYVKSRVSPINLMYYKNLLAAIAGHHGKYPINSLQGNGFDRALLGGQSWLDHQRQCLDDLMEVFEIRSLPSIIKPSNTVLIQVAGMCTRVDWIGSQSHVFQYTNNNQSPKDYYDIALSKAQKAVSLSLPHSTVSQKPSGIPFNEVFSFDPRPAQVIGEKIAKTNWRAAVIEAPMGDGKTEMALYLMRDMLARGKRGFYFALPTQATSNSMYERISEFLQNSGESVEIHLLHNRAEFIDKYVDERESWRNDKDADAWLADSTKLKLLMNQGVGTLDQILTGVLFAKHGPMRLHSMEDKVIILDEIHAYDAYTTSILERYLEWLHALGCCVIMLSATLPASNRDRLIRTFTDKNAVIPDGDYPSVTWVDDTGVHINTFEARKKTTIALEYLESTIEDIDINSMADEAVKMAQQGAKVAVICNTVSRSQEVYELIKARFDDTMIFHARMPFAWRMDRENQVLSRFGKETSVPIGQGVVLVATQVVEQSLDIDFDAMITELCPVDMLLQRSGRLHRHDKSRPVGFETPKLHVCIPRIINQSRFAPVMPYDLFLQYRTYACLKDKHTLSIPEDVYEMIQYVYEDATVPESTLFSDHYFKCKQEYDSKQASRQREAFNYVIESPKSQNNVLSCLKGLLADEQAVQITARLGLESIQAVLLFETPDGKVCPIDRPDLAFDLATSPLRQKKMVNAILQGSVSLNNKKIVKHFKGVTPLDNFATSSVLRPLIPIVLRKTDTAWINTECEINMIVKRENGIELLKRKK